MSAAHQILDELHSLEVEVVSVGGRLLFRPTSAVGPELLARLRQEKPALLELLRADRGPWPVQTWPLTEETFRLRTLADLSMPGLIGEPAHQCYSCGGYPRRWRPLTDRTRWRCWLCCPPRMEEEIEEWEGEA